MSNDGIGPAKLESFELFWHPRPVLSAPEHALRQYGLLSGAYILGVTVTWTSAAERPTT